MDVTAENFDVAATQLESLLPTCAFYAIDEEMTGIMLSKETAPTMGDVCEQRYAKMRRVVHEFTLMQVGICLFHEQPDGSFLSRPFNFYVFPGASSRRRIVMDASTAHFHRSNHMDFNKWVLQGVPYLSAAEYDAEAEALLAEPAPQARPRLTLTRDDDVTFMATVLAQLHAWLEEPWAEDGAPSELALPATNPFLRRALFEEVEQLRAERPELQAESRAVEGEADKRKKQVVVLRLSAAAQRARAEAARTHQLAELDKRAGFLRVWRALCASRKPLVGHNLLYDLLFLHDHFEGPLPPTLGACKATLHARLPLIWDTKLLATRCGRFSETALGPLHAACVGGTPTPPVAVGFAPGFERYDGGEQAHEAGYDAHMTGVVLAALRHAELAPEAACNRCYLMRSLYELCLGEEGDRLADSTAAAFHLSFDASTLTSDLLAIFTATAAPDGAPLRPTLRWLDSTSAFVLVPQQHEDAARAALDAARPAVRSLTLDEWRMNVALNMNAPVAPPAGAAPLQGRAAAAPPTAGAGPSSTAPAATEAVEAEAPPAAKRRRRGAAQAEEEPALASAPRRSGRLGSVEGK